MPSLRTFAALATVLTVSTANAQATRPPAAVQASTLPESTFAGLSFRNIGPANMSGRMADVCAELDRLAELEAAAG